MAERPELAAVLADIRAGDTGAMQALYELYSAQLLRWCLFRLGEIEAAQDVLQDVFVQVWQGLRAFEYRGETAFVGWLYRIAHNAVVTHLRKRQRQSNVLLSAVDEPLLSGTDMARSVCDRLALRQAIGRLCPAQQQVIGLRYFAGLTNGETALVLNRSEGAVKAIHHRALQRLQKQLSIEAAPLEPVRFAALAAQPA